LRAEYNTTVDGKSWMAIVSEQYSENVTRENIISGSIFAHVQPTPCQVNGNSVLGKQKTIHSLFLCNVVVNRFYYLYFYIEGKDGGAGLISPGLKFQWNNNNTLREFIPESQFTFDRQFNRLDNT